MLSSLQKHVVCFLVKHVFVAALDTSDQYIILPAGLALFLSALFVSLCVHTLSVVSTGGEHMDTTECCTANLKLRI